MGNFEGIPNVNGVLPPDTVGDIGPNHYVQMVNLAYAVYDRNGVKLYGPVNTSTLWQGFGGACEGNNDGDPIVLYDPLADRWFLSQFAMPNFPSGPFYQCIAVSQTGNPLGAYHRYQFLVSNVKMNDYPKFGVWPDGYYMSINQYTCNVFSCSWGGAGTAVFERAAMLAGGPARMVYFDLFNVDPNLGGFLPSDLDGLAPPAGTPNFFAEIDDDAWGYSPDQVQIWALTANWTNPLSSTFSPHTILGVSSFDSNMCGYARDCIPQSGTSRKLDAISDRAMFRLQFRNFGTYQTLVTNHTVDVNSADRAGLRWYELRRTTGDWGIHQEGTFSPDSNHRWMASAAMNGAGQIALGYSISSTGMKPSIRATGRVSSDPLGTLPQGETTIQVGGGYQSHSSSRWGDYSAMSVDPTDDCTFWYTTEYHDVNSSASWNTRIASFKIASCGPVDNPPTVDLTAPPNGATVMGTAVQLAATASDDSGVTKVEFKVDGAIICTDTGAPYQCSWDTTTGYAEGSHTVSAVATDTNSQTATDTHSVTVDNVPDPKMHIGDLDGSKSNQRNKWQATVTIAVHDGGVSHAAVSSATVTGTWSNGGTSNCTTGIAGTCSVTKSNISNGTASVTFNVTNVTHASMAYDAAVNHDVDGGTNGTSIVVNK
ncbi:MAG: hypothetical protein JJE04_21370 [Acidobacteriia bacterium]|nr:hypothetical protein [Terriglobia bacterium]